MPALYPLAATAVVLTLAALGWDTLPLLAVTIVIWGLAAAGLTVAVGTRPHLARSAPFWCMVAFCFLITATAATSRWPVRLGPALYHRQFQTLADQVAAGQSFTEPRRIGPFTFLRGGVERDCVCLWTDLDPAGRTGFIRGSARHVLAFNAWSLASAGQDWHFLMED